ncbi:Pre-rRNA-processing protein ESF1 [Babesia sp. Xinjiang]|uniref:Pre-rRNA-processing protein ESF1 n=1 Tax=Babesia sp. Xinjiang TaxID=462227 RepID=UPI000A23164F|nr:Pre-rRNA-processing protein ESF1 [Babesia sp. Xinjiang]ORM42253.1 Pre-rRNA-processing protein ESF1 [Babesia sp. Xinjiang]
MHNLDEQVTPTQASVDGNARSFDMPRSSRLREELCFQASEMPTSHIMALDQLIQYQCAHLEKQLVALKVKRELLHQGKTVFVSLNELVSEECLEAAEDLLSSVSAGPSIEAPAAQPYTLSRSRTVGDEISHIIDSINTRKANEEESDGLMRRVQFTAIDTDSTVCTQAPRRSVTLPEGRSSGPIGDVSDEDAISSDSESEEPLESGPTGSAVEAEEDTQELEYGDATNRVAVVGCDWDNISASDLFVLFETMYRSLTSNHTGCVKRAAVYLSDFGKERLEQESLHGPSIGVPDDVREEELDEETRQEALRKYQKDRSRYYYGIVEFETTDQAKLLYDEMDGVEAYFAFASLDLRFVPGDIVFDRDPTSECFEMPINYEPPMESTSAFRHSRVECKWDLPSTKRFKTLTKRFKEQDIESLDVKEYLASEDDDDVNVEEYKSILLDKSDTSTSVISIDGNIGAKIGKYSISFGAFQDMPDLDEPKMSTLQEDIKGRKSSSGKRKSKRARKSVDEELDDVRDFDARLSQEQQPGFDGKLDDSRFKRVLHDPDFAIDTRHPKYRVQHRFQQESSKTEGGIKALRTMLNIDIGLLRRFLLAGASADAAAELLRSVTVDEIVLNLSQLGDESFPSSCDEDCSLAETTDDRYPGTILVRVLDDLLDVERLGSLFHNPQIMDLLSARLLTGSFPVRLLFVQKCKLYFSKNGKSNDKLTEVLWRLLFDSEYRIFESASQALCLIVERDPHLLTPLRLEELATTVKVGDSDGILGVRVIEFCASLGSTSPVAFKALLGAGLYDAMFNMYMTADCLVKLNCLEIMERMPTFVYRLQESSAIPREFITHALSTASSDGHHSGDDLIAPFLFKFLLFLLRQKASLTTEDSARFGVVVSRVIMQGTPRTISPIFLSALECFGPLYLLGHISPDVCHKIEEMLSGTAQESVLLSVVASLSRMGDEPLGPEHFSVFHALTRRVVTALPRFPLSEVRESVYTFLTKAVRFDGILRCILEEESKTHLFSSEENLYSTTVAKKQLVKLVLQLVEDSNVESDYPLRSQCINALRRYACS